MLKHLIPPSRLHTPFVDQKAIIHGADYNPDQWLSVRPDIIREDAQIMHRTGINTVSVAIFAWSALEPQEGTCTFDWLDRLLDEQHKIGNRVILATPSGAMPTWLAEKYPDARRVDKQGRRALYGFRHNHCWSSPSYHDHVRQINTQLATRYKDHPALSMWHVSNELGGECYCDLCRARWAKWLEEKYGTLKPMNDAFWTYFWSHQAFDWKQVEPTDFVMDGMKLDWMRFTNEQLADWYKFERDILRGITPDIPITTNFMGIYYNINYQKLAHEVDVITDDQYPSYDAAHPDFLQNAIFMSMKHDMYRCFKPERTMMLMESCPGAVQWKTPQKAKRPDIHRLEMLQAIAHGADGTCYFQFRAGRGGLEKLHSAVVEHWDTQRHEQTRRFRELRSLSDAYAKFTSVLGASVHASVALVYDWESRWAQQLSDGTGLSAPAWNSTSLPYFNQVAAEQYENFWHRGIPVDVIDNERDLSTYKLVILPMHWIMTDALAQRLKQYVQSGGTLIATWDTAMSDEHNRMLLGGAPGPVLGEVFGLWVEETDRLLPGTPRAIDGLAGAGGDVAAVIHSLGAKPIASFADDYYTGQPAVTYHTFGKGRAYYIGTRLNAEARTALYGAIINELKLDRVIDAPLPHGVTAQLRGAGDDAFVTLLNFTTSEQEVPLGSRKLKDLQTAQLFEQSITLAPLQASIYRLV